MNNLPQFHHIPDLPRDEGGPMFAEPWQLTAFGIVYDLHQRGHFEWREWVDRLSDEIAKNETYGSDDLNTIYYNQWLSALERLVADKELSSEAELLERREAWRQADEHRGFGEPLHLHGHGHSHDHSRTVALGEPICRSPSKRLA